MNKKPGQRIALYEITAAPDNVPEQLTVGKILVDRPRGESTCWEFLDHDRTLLTIHGKRLGFARINPDGNSHTPEPALQAKLDEMKAAA